MADEIDWIPEKRVKELKFFREEIFTQFKEVFDLLNNDKELEAFLALLKDEQREELYNHPILNHYDLLP